MNLQQFKSDIEYLLSLIEASGPAGEAVRWFDAYFDPAYDKFLSPERWRWFLYELRDYFHDEAKHLLRATSRDYIAACAREVLEDIATEQGRPDGATPPSEDCGPPDASFPKAQ